MGGKTSRLCIYNKTSYYQITIKNSEPDGIEFKVYKDNYIIFQDMKDQLISIYVYDDKGRIVKFVTILTKSDDSWIINQDGIRKQMRGEESEERHNEDPNGPFYKWAFDNEEYYNQIDKIEEERYQIRKEKDERRKLRREKKQREVELRENKKVEKLLKKKLTQS